MKKLHVRKPVIELGSSKQIYSSHVTPEFMHYSSVAFVGFPKRFLAPEKVKSQDFRQEGVIEFWSYKELWGSTAVFLCVFTAAGPVIDHPKGES